jgi:sialate O-acetylesterase
MLVRVLVGVGLCLCGIASAEVRLPHVLSDHAVLQREQPVRIWGWATPAENVTVAFHGQTLQARANAFGAWEVWLRPEAAGGPFVLTVSGDDTAVPLQRTDVLVGDVWVASGQSNMEMPLAGFGPGTPVKDAEKEIAAANQPRLRLLVQRKRNSDAPQRDSEDTWSVCTPETAKMFSAVAYFFGRKVSEEEGVPVGLIDTTWGGTPAQSWISSEGIAWAGLGNMPIETANAMRDVALADDAHAEFAAEDAAAKAAGKPVLVHPKAPGGHAPFTPIVLYNGMIAPYVKYTIKGAIWYQGETDHDVPNRSLYYSRVFPAMIQDWRKQWGEGEFPFLFVLDIGTPNNVHPPDKETVGARLAQTALGMVYGRKVEAASPLFVEATTEGASMRAWFSHAKGLSSPDAVVGDFEVAGADHKFVAATAKIEKIGEDETVVASAPGVAAPMYVRYGWTPVVTSYLYNVEGLPMGTFTSETDEWMLVH